MNTLTKLTPRISTHFYILFINSMDIFRLKYYSGKSEEFIILVSFRMKSLFLVKFLIWILIFLVEMNGYRSCIDKERKGLLELKAFIESVSEDPAYTAYVLSTWSNNTKKSDCCEWEGIECNATTKRVINLAVNGSANYEATQAFLNLSLLYPFEELERLGFFGNSFDGWFDDIEGYKSLGRLKKLKTLNLGWNLFNTSILPFLGVLTSLETLILSHNRMEGPFPIKELGNLRNLRVLDLSSNMFNGSLPWKALVNLSKLEALDLSSNGFSGSLQMQELCELKNLQELDLSKNNFKAHQIPEYFCSLSKLRVLDLSSNQLSGNLSSITTNVPSVEYLSLSNNSFEAFLSLSSLAGLSKLKVFKLSSNSGMLQVETDSFWRPTFSLRVIQLRSLNLEKIPNFLQYQHELQLIDLSYNKLTGTFPSWLLENNPKLATLILQSNSFTSLQLPNITHDLRHLDISNNKIHGQLPKNIGLILPNLAHVNLLTNRFQENLPSSICDMKSLSFLDLSHNNLSGELPRSLFINCSSLAFLKLSNNSFHGQIFPKFMNLANMEWLFLDNNHFMGMIEDGLLNSSFLQALDISHNLLTGTIPSWIGNFSYLQVLSMSNNLLEGTILGSVSNLISITHLDLSGNMLSGSLPSQFNFTFRGDLFLQDNDLTGSIPDTLLENVRTLDLRKNKLSGNIPIFIHIQMITLLLLGGNKLTGGIPHQLCELNEVAILDLSYNKLNGSIPSCLKNISFGVREEDNDDKHSYKDMMISLIPNFGIYTSTLELEENYEIFDINDVILEIEFVMKHRYDSFKGDNIGYMFGLDLSNNELTGEIPAEIGDLHKVRSLNLSHNHLKGLIPVNFANLKDIENLDLSFNNLQGQMPAQLTKLNSLAVFNVSYNDLKGIIPRGAQFNTFDESSYFGNHLLCGPPTTRSCNNEEAQDSEGEDDESFIDMTSFYWSLGASYVTILLGLLGFLRIDSPWSRAWFQLVDDFLHSVTSVPYKLAWFFSKVTSTF